MGFRVRPALGAAAEPGPLLEALWQSMGVCKSHAHGAQHGWLQTVSSPWRQTCSEPCLLAQRLKRVVCVQALIDVAEVFGEAWTTAKAVPLVLRQLQEQFYLFRITCMQVCHMRELVFVTVQASVTGVWHSPAFIS